MMRLLASLLLINAALSAAIVEGNEQSHVRVVIFEDLQCTDCAAFRVMLDARLLVRYGRNVAFEHHDFPLTKHRWARKAAVAARYFDSQNPKLGLEFRRLMFTNIDNITPDELASWVATFARNYGVDPVKAVESMTSPALMALVDKDVADGTARGVVKTPTVFVNGEPFVEKFTLEAISKSIDAALEAPKP